MSKNRDLANYGTAALEDASVSATGDSVVKRDASGNVSAVDVYASGNLGVGVASASYPLHVVGSHTIYGAALESSSTSTTSYNVMRWIQGAGSGAPVGYIGTGGSSTSNAGFAGTFGIGTQTANPVTFLTNDTERMRIDSSGNVLIGASSPYATFSPAQLRLDGGYINSATPTNQQLKLSLLSASATEAYGFTADNLAGLWYHAGNSAGATGAHVFATAGTERLRIDSSGNVGIGLTSPRAKVEINQSVNKSAIRISEGSHNLSADTFLYPALTYYARADNVPRTADPLGTSGASAAIVFTDRPGTYTYASAVRSSDIRFYTANSFDGTSLGTYPVLRFEILAGGVTRQNGDFQVTGSLSKGSGSFKIDHPLKPDTHHLVHSFVEAPQADNIYRGKAKLQNGFATVNIDEAARMTEGTFVALNTNIQCFTSNEEGWCCVRGSVDGNILTIEAKDEDCEDTISWMVIGERQDQHMLDTGWTDENGRVIVEPEKVATPDDSVMQNSVIDEDENPEADEETEALES